MNSEEMSHICSVRAVGDCLYSHKFNGKSEQDTLHFTSKVREHNTAQHFRAQGDHGISWWCMNTRAQCRPDLGLLSCSMRCLKEDHRVLFH